MTRTEIEEWLVNNDKLLRQIVGTEFHIPASDTRYEDCMQEARFAAYNALCTYNESVGSAVTTYVWKVVENELYYYIPKDSIIKVSNRAVQNRTSLNRKVKAGEDLTESEVATLNSINGALNSVISLNEPQNAEETVSMMDNLPSSVDIERTFEFSELCNTVYSWINKLENSLHREILTEYFDTVIDGEKPNMSAIAVKHGITKEAVRQVVQKMQKNLSGEVAQMS